MNRYLSSFSCKTLCLITGVLFFSTVYGQSAHYLFIQTENNQPFYLRLMGANLSSNATGYLLIPKLSNGEYELNIGFAQSDKEQKFTIKVEGKDLGFSLKQELDNNWSLFNLVDFSLIKGLAVAVQSMEVKKAVVVEIPDEPIKEPIKQVGKEQETKPTAIKEVVQSPKAIKVLPEIKKIYDKATEEGIDMVFIVSGSPKNDTVILYVPALKPKGEAGLIKDLTRQQVNNHYPMMIIDTNPSVFTRPKLF